MVLDIRKIDRVSITRVKSDIDALQNQIRLQKSVLLQEEKRSELLQKRSKLQTKLRTLQGKKTKDTLKSITKFLDKIGFS